MVSYVINFDMLCDDVIHAIKRVCKRHSWKILENGVIKLPKIDAGIFEFIFSDFEPLRLN